MVVEQNGECLGVGSVWIREYDGYRSAILGQLMIIDDDFIRPVVLRALLDALENISWTNKCHEVVATKNQVRCLPYIF